MYEIKIGFEKIITIFVTAGKNAVARRSSSSNTIPVYHFNVNMDQLQKLTGKN